MSLAFVYEHADFQGRWLEAEGDLDDLGPMKGRAGSIITFNAGWLAFCAEPRGGGARLIVKGGVAIPDLSALPYPAGDKYSGWKDRVRSLAAHAESPVPPGVEPDSVIVDRQGHAYFYEDSNRGYILKRDVYF